MFKSVLSCVVMLAVLSIDMGSLHAEPVDQAPQLPVIQPVQRLGSCTHMRRRDRGWRVEKLLPIVRQAGFGTIRDGLSWSRTESVKGQYALDPLDKQWIDAALASDVKIILMLGYGNNLYDNPLDPQGYADFCAWVAAHFKDNPNILALELWNEPSNFHVRKRYGGSWNAKGDAPWLEHFAQMVTQAAQAIKQVDPSRTVITSAGNPPASIHMMTRYPKAFEHVDGLTLHPYSYRFPPEVIPYGGPSTNQRDGARSAGDDHSMVSLWQTLEAHMQEKLGRKLGIWVTEVGYTSFNHTLKPGLFAGYAEPVQAAYLLRGSIAALAWDNIKTWCIYDLMNDGRNPAINEDNFGIVRHHGQGLAPKPAFYALRRLAESLGGYEQYLDQPIVALANHVGELDQNDHWKKLPVDNYITDRSPRAYWFKTDQGYVTFIWRAGRINGEHNPPLGTLPPVDVPSDTQVQILDLVSGASLNHLVQRAGNEVRIANIPLSGFPLAIRWKTAGQIKPVTMPMPGQQMAIALTHARGAWRFNPGYEFKGAKGSITVPDHDDSALQLRYDFSGGGKYVAAIKQLDPALAIESIHMTIDRHDVPLTLRVVDQSGQTFQYKLGQASASGAFHLDLSKAKPSDVWGGAKDRNIHYPLSHLWILVQSNVQPKVGTIRIKSINVQLMP